MTPSSTRLATLVLALMLALGVSFQAEAQVKPGRTLFLDDDQQVELLDYGDGWRKVRVYQAEDRSQSEVLVMLSPEGLSTAPLHPNEIKQLRDDFGNDASKNDMIVVHQGMAEAIATGGPIPESFQPYVGKSYHKNCFGWDDKEKTQNWTFDGWDTQDDFTLGGGVSGNYRVDLPVTGQATAIINYSIKEAACIPYKIRFDQARIFGNMQLNGDSLLDAEATIQGHWEDEWELAEPKLGGFTVWLGPIPIDFDFYLPIHAGFSLDVALTGTLTIDADFGADGTFDYTCNRDTCWGTNDFDSFDLVEITSGLELEVDAEVWARAMVRVDIWSKKILHAAVGVRGFVQGELWGYYGNHCGDADGDGVNETVEALAAEARAGYNLAYAYGGLLISDDYSESDGGRYYLGWTDLLGDGGSTALSPMIDGPSTVEVDTPSEYTVRMRPCYPYSDAVNLALSPGAWTGGLTIPDPQSDDPQLNAATVQGTFAQIGSTTLQATAISDAQGRDLAGKTTKSIHVMQSVCDSDVAKPTVAVTSPAPGALLSSGPVTIHADASDDVGVARVDFLIDNVVVGSDETAPYTYTWNATVGAHAVRARAVDLCNKRRNHVVQVTVTDSTTCTTDNLLPSVSLDAPADGALLQPGAITLAASASDASGIANVQFRVDGSLLATDSSAPYSATWNATQGGHQLQVTATDGCGNTASESVLVTVEPPDVCDSDVIDPWINMTYPTASSQLTQGTITITADAGDANGVEKVQFFIDGLLQHADFDAPYAYSWNAEPGTYEIKVRAIDHCGRLEAVTRTVTVQASNACQVDSTPPAVGITSPADGATLDAGNVTISASASDANGIGSVAFQVDGTTIGTDSTAPYSIVWNAGAGAHTVNVVATDSCGNQRPDTISVTVEPGPPDCSTDHQDPFIDMTYPTATSSLSPGIITIQASASDASGIDRVQFFIDDILEDADFTAPYTYAWNAPPGTHTVKVRALDTCGNLKAFTRTVTVGDPAGCSADSQKPTVVLLSPVHGATVAAGQTMLLEATASDASGIEKVQFFLGTQLLGADFTPPYTFPWAPQAGPHDVKARAWDNCGNFKADLNSVTAQ